MGRSDRGRSAGGDDHQGAGRVSGLRRTSAASLVVLAFTPAACSIEARDESTTGQSLGRAHVGLAESTAPANVVEPQPEAGSCHYRGRGLYSEPDPRCTSGALNPAVTAATIGSTICREGWTATVRPLEWVSEAEKRASMAAYGSDAPLSDAEEDHDVPLSLGGAVNDPRNMWPEPRASPNPKDRLERDLSELVCRGRISLVFAQRLIARDWIAAGRWVQAHLPGFRWRVS
jgi:hypothetical protein